MYACVVKNSQNTWDIYGFAAYPSNPEKQARLEAAVDSGLPITGMILTPYKWSATPGAVWDGESFSVGSSSTIPETIDWDLISVYGYLCNNIIIYGSLTSKSNIVAQQMDAIFAGDSEISIIKVPENQTAKIGDIWDGENIISI
jgi:hypothetical protein